MQARRLDQAELADATGMHTAEINRLVKSKRPLTTRHRLLLMPVLECTEADFYLPMGSPIGPSKARDPQGVAPGFELRLRAISAELDLEQIIGLLYFVLSDDTSRLTPKVARRIRERLKGLTLWFAMSLIAPIAGAL